MMKRNSKQYGFTLVELMMALIIASVILSAVATLASAATSAHEATDEMGREQAQFRQINMQVSDLIKRSSTVYHDETSGYYAFDWCVVLCYDLNADGDYTDADEKVWVYHYDNSLRMKGESDQLYTQCQNPTFQYRWEDGQPRTVIICFDMTENGQTQQYSIVAHLRAFDN